MGNDRNAPASTVASVGGLPPSLVLGRLRLSRNPRGTHNPRWILGWLSMH